MTTLVKNKLEDTVKVWQFLISIVVLLTTITFPIIKSYWDMNDRQIRLESQVSDAKLPETIQRLTRIEEKIDALRNEFNKRK